MNCLHCDMPIGQGLTFCENCGTNAISANHATPTASNIKLWALIGLGGMVGLGLGTVALFGQATPSTATLNAILKDPIPTSVSGYYKMTDKFHYHR
jgi:hypothetical protein